MGRNTLNSYAAGLMDGEGCIRWNKTPTVEVTNKNGKVLREMAAKWGGTIRERDEEVFVWTMYGRRALQFLKNVARYSVIKHPQIVALFAACAATTSPSRARHLNTLRNLKHVHPH